MKQFWFLDSHGVVYEGYTRYPLTTPPGGFGPVVAFGPTGFSRETPWHITTFPWDVTVEEGEDGWTYID